jgi:hypothetical protein
LSNKHKVFEVKMVASINKNILFGYSILMKEIQEKPTNEEKIVIWKKIMNYVILNDELLTIVRLKESISNNLYLWLIVDMEDEEYREIHNVLMNKLKIN